MAEFTCPKCGNSFHGIACRGCIPNVKGYICSRCGEHIPSHEWGGMVHQWLKTDMIAEWSKEGAYEVEDVKVDALPKM